MSEVCPGCRAVNAANARSCGACGTRLGVVQRIATVPDSRGVPTAWIPAGAHPIAPGPTPTNGPMWGSVVLWAIALLLFVPGAYFLRFVAGDGDEGTAGGIEALALFFLGAVSGYLGLIAATVGFYLRAPSR